jgi:hypothetical protein
MGLAEPTESDGGKLVKRIGSYRTDPLVAGRVSSAGGGAHEMRMDTSMTGAEECPSGVLREVGHD